jgi:hypothetical protein
MLKKSVSMGLSTRPCSCFILWIVTLLICCPESLPASQVDPSPPKEPVKLIFIHHSCGENWLGDGHGGLGRALAKNGYFVSDTNYGWGPDGIGDRTDITDWPEWFVGPRSGHYLRALFHESGQHSSYTRHKTDPGGENRIIMFKSCFPNSNLHGRPQDSPARGSGLTVANAKAIYRDLLRYFAKRPDKLFIAITAPPVQERTYGANARAFNNWLVHEWLADYKGSNVAVFDFYNVLTGPGNHHRLRNGRVEHVYTKGRNHLFYPTNGDDHPSPGGNRKATDEFMPLLNAYYHRWKTNALAAVVTKPPEPAVPKEVAEEAEKREERPAPTACAPSKPIISGGIIDDFEGDGPEWAAFVDASNDTRLSFVRDSSQSHNGEKSLRIDYHVAPESWATCSLVLAAPADWRMARGLIVWVHSSESGQPVTLTAYQGKSSDSLSHFELKTETTGDAVSGWQKISATWDRLKQPPWEGDGNTPFNPGSAMGIAFAFSGGEKGCLWVDDIRFIEGDGNERR